MNGLALKVPPGVLVLIVAALMWQASSSVPAFSFMFPARHVLAGCLMLAGVVVIGLGVVSFRRAGTTVNPMKPQSASSLVASGIYRRTRNPMYLGFLFGLLGWAIFLSNMLAFLFLPVFVLYMNRFQIEPEERALTSLFGQEFVAYRSRVRRWI